MEFWEWEDGKVKIVVADFSLCVLALFLYQFDSIRKGKVRLNGVKDGQAPLPSEYDPPALALRRSLSALALRSDVKRLWAFLLVIVFL